MRLLHISHVDQSGAEHVNTLARNSKSFPDFQAVLNSTQASAFTRWSEHFAKNGFEAMTVIRNCPDLLSLLARECRITGFWDLDTLLTKVVSYLQPDVLMVDNPHDYSPDLLLKLKAACRLLVAWQEQVSFSASSLASVDLFISPSAVARNDALRCGAKDAKEFYLGAFTRIERANKHDAGEVDILFQGDWRNLDQHGRQLLLELSKGALGWHGGYSMRFYMPQHTDVEQMPIGVAMQVECIRSSSFFAELPHAKIVLHIAPQTSVADPPDSFIFEHSLAGALVLADSRAELGRFFEPLSEIAICREPSDAAQQIRWLLDHDSERCAIASNGQRRCLQEHNFSTRISELSTDLLSRLQL